MKRLSQIIKDSEDWLMSRVLGYAKERGYTLYTSTLVEAWRLSISGLSESILEALAHYPDIPEMSPDEDFTHDSVARFGIMEAKRHRERGVSLAMFLGLMKYYRQSYLDLLHHQGLQPPEVERYGLLLNRVFDRIEIGFCTEWTGGDSDRAIQELQVNNRLMTNEKNKYLTIFESIPIPVILLNVANEIENMNLAATSILDGVTITGSRYYSRPDNEPLDNKHDASELEADLVQNRLSGADLFNLLPWLKEAVAGYIKKDVDSIYMEKETDFFGERKYFGVRITKNLDVSEKFDGIVIIFEDISLRKNEQKILIEREKLQAALETVGMVSHELGQPLQVIMGMAELMLLDPVDIAEQKNQLGQIIAAVKNLSAIIGKLDKINAYRTKGYVGNSSILDLDDSIKDKD